MADIAKWIGAEARRRGRDRLVMYRTVGILGLGLAASLLVNAATILGYIDWTPSSGSVDAARMEDFERRLRENEAKANDAHHIGTEAQMIGCHILSLSEVNVNPQNCRKVADQYYDAVKDLPAFPGK